MEQDEANLTTNMQGNEIKKLAEVLVEQFRADGAVNFVTMKMEHVEFGSFSVTMQKDSGVTPAEKVVALEKALEDEVKNRDYWESEITRLADAVGVCLDGCIGEWSSDNDPVANAHNLLHDAMN